MVVSYSGKYVASSTSRQVLVHELPSGWQVLQLQHANLAKPGAEPTTVAASCNDGDSPSLMERAVPSGKHSFWK
jgi:hypothetical protein